MLADLASDDAPQSFEQGTFDLLIIGSGPVGLAIANEFVGQSFRIGLIESGGLRPEPQPSDAVIFENVGEPRESGDDVRQVRAFGGTSNVWSGRCAPLNDIDFEPRAWVPLSGWPFGHAEMTPFLDRAAAHLGLIPHSYVGDPRTDPKRKGLRPQSWQYSQDQSNPNDFARPGPSYLARPGPNIDVLLHATVTRVILGENGSLSGVEIASPKGTRYRILCRCAILCAGGVENARLLLMSWRGLAVPPPSAANTGRFLMDHPRATMGVFDGRDIDRLSVLFGLRLRGRGRLRHSFTLGVALSPEEQCEAHLLNCAAWITEIRAADDPWDALRRLISGTQRRPGDAAAALRHFPTITRGALRALGRRRGVLHKCDALHLDCLVEQVPNPESRLTLGDRRDSLGLPISRIDWKISDVERASLLRLSDNIVQELKRLALPLPRPAPGFAERDPARILLRDVAHPMGTTRMARDVSAGVVDENCRVHGVEGLYVAGSSVFPTGGHANPTFMAIALAVRLSDYLKRAALTRARTSSLQITSRSV